MGRQLVADWEVAAALWRGETLPQIAQREGVAYQTVYAAARRWKEAGGEIPELRRGGSKSPQAASRRAQIVEMYQSGKSMGEIGLSIGVSLQRVQQLISRAEHDAGRQISRHGRRKLRIEWHCESCGAKQLTTASRQRLARGKCKACNFDKIPSTIIHNWIEERRAGRSWRAIAIDAGYPSQQSFAVQRIAYLYLRRHDRPVEIAVLWPSGIPHWLQQKSSKTAEDRQ